MLVWWTPRHIDRTLGAPINTFVIAAKTCISVLREEDAKEVRMCMSVLIWLISGACMRIDRQQLTSTSSWV